MRTTNYNIKNAKIDTTFNGFNVIFPFDISEKLFKLDVRKCGLKVVVKSFELESGLTLVSETKLKFDKQIIDIPPGDYEYDLLMYEEDGEYKRYLSGLWTIEETITRV